MKRSVRLTSRECGRLCGSAISKLYKHNLRLSTGFQQIARFSTQTQCGGARLAPCRRGKTRDASVAPCPLRRGPRLRLLQTAATGVSDEACCQLFILRKIRDE